VAGVTLGSRPRPAFWRESAVATVFTPRAESDGAAMAATAMRVVNAVPYVVAAPAGLLSSLDIPNTFPRHVFQ
jgi:hypothetical protein